MYVNVPQSRQVLQISLALLFLQQIIMGRMIFQSFEANVPELGEGTWQGKIHISLRKPGFDSFLKRVRNGEVRSKPEDADRSGVGLCGVEKVVEESLAGVGGEEVEFVQDEDDGFRFRRCRLIVVF